MSDSPRPRLNLRIGAILIAIILMVIAVSVQFFTNDTQQTIPLKTTETSSPEAQTPSSAPTASNADPEFQALIYVHVVGEVKNPGLVGIKNGARISEAIDKAGGLTSEAAEQAVNLAQVVEDGAQIYVPHQDNLVPNQVSTDAATNASSSTDSNKINLNTAAEEDLVQLHGIGPATAQKIIDFRDEQGPFQTVEDLLSVSGIGPSTLEKLIDHVSVG